MIRELAYGFAGLVFLAYVVDLFLSIKDDPLEPRRIRPKVPLIGHILGLMQHGPTYYNHMSDATGEEIYTLPMLHYKIYVSAVPRLLPHIQKQSKALSFRPFLQIVARKHGDASKEAYDIFGGTVTDDLSHSVKMNLNPGESLDDLNLRMGKRALIEVDALSNANSGRGQQIYLLEWARHAVIQATSCAIYGEKHPFLEPEVETAFWKWQTYLTAHLAGWLDPFGTGYTARDKVFDAYIKYSKQNSDNGSQLARDHQQVLRDASVPELDNAKQAAIFTIASFSNSAPTLYWTLWELFSRHEILAEVREELEAQAISGSKETASSLTSRLSSPNALFWSPCFKKRSDHAMSTLASAKYWRTHGWIENTSSRRETIFKCPDTPSTPTQTSGDTLQSSILTVSCPRRVRKGRCRRMGSWHGAQRRICVPRGSLLPLKYSSWLHLWQSGMICSPSAECGRNLLT